ncbi:hypothetical protein POM88_006116 [Heracleum sosnowskyi]|uniref:Uncharacterized protein n=1 Tax=Heracleum sosnowskyi TaxID=360622 RepID=A0AAD8J478_9APIA|nr:hypothetical protein POM88_006116 [Heracleum sosnowskyi]
MSDQHLKKRMKSLFSFYKRDGGNSTQAPAPASSNHVLVTPNQPNHLPMDEIEVIVETPNKPSIQTDHGLRDPICCMMFHIENEYVDGIDSEAIIDHFESIGDRKAQFR